MAALNAVVKISLFGREGLSILAEGHCRNLRLCGTTSCRRLAHLMELRLPSMQFIRT